MALSSPQGGTQWWTTGTPRQRANKEIVAQAVDAQQQTSTDGRPHELKLSAKVKERLGLEHLKMFDKVSAAQLMKLTKELYHGERPRNLAAAQLEEGGDGIVPRSTCPRTLLGHVAGTQKTSPLGVRLFSPNGATERTRPTE